MPFVVSCVLLIEIQNIYAMFILSSHYLFKKGWTHYNLVPLLLKIKTII